MKCPFRTDKNGEFMECYGKDCMAYLEYDMPLYSIPKFDNQNQIIDHNVATSHVTMCKRMIPPPVSYGGCT